MIMCIKQLLFYFVIWFLNKSNLQLFQQICTVTFLSFAILYLFTVVLLIFFTSFILPISSLLHTVLSLHLHACVVQSYTNNNYTAVCLCQRNYSLSNISYVTQNLNNARRILRITEIILIRTVVGCKK